MEKQPNYRTIKNYVLARGLVILAESIRKTDYHSNYFNKREFAVGWWKTEDKWEHQGITDINHRKQLSPGEEPRNQVEVSRSLKFEGRVL